MMMHTNWLNYHIYYQDEFNKLLCGPLSTLVNTFNAEYNECLYFFIRYWQGGPHLRLRFKCDVKQSPAIATAIETEFNSYLIENPSQTILTNENKAYKTINRNFAQLENELEPAEFEKNNTLVTTQYNPEYHKYGGKLGICIAEDVFVTSSKLTIQIINNHPDISRSKLYELLIYYMLISVDAFGFNTEKKYHYFNSYYLYWKNYLELLQTDYNVLLKTTYDTNRKRLKKLVTQQAKDILQIDNKYRQWYACLTQATDSIKQAADTIKQNITEPNAKRNYIEYLLTQYIHTHNNRHGLMAFEEALLGYLIAQSLKEIM